MAEWKDIVKIEDRELDPRELDKISLISPNATINIIRDYNVAEKFVVEVPDVVKGIVRCQNPGCITNLSEPIEPEFVVESKKPLLLRCIYCDRIMTDASDYLI
jgi:aspartate carbamoyltransferase regulatory subunit